MIPEVVRKLVVFLIGMESGIPMGKLGDSVVIRKTFGSLRSPWVHILLESDSDKAHEKDEGHFHFEYGVGWCRSFWIQLIVKNDVSVSSTRL